MKLIMENWKKYLEEQSGPEETSRILHQTDKTAIRNQFAPGQLNEMVKIIDDLGYPGETIMDRYISKKAKEMRANKSQLMELDFNDVADFVKSEMARYKKTDLKQKSKTQKPTDNPAEFDPTDHRNWRSDL